MSTPLRVLILEDRAEDAELAAHELRRAGFEPDWQRVQTEVDFLAALESRPEIILSDHNMPQFNSRRALKILNEQRLQIPLILVSGTIGEEDAVDIMKLGAVDYILKDRRARLGEAVRRALEEKKLQEEKQQAEQLLKLSEERYRRVAEVISDYAYGYRFKPTGDAVLEWVTEAYHRITGHEPEELASLDGWLGLVHPEDKEIARGHVERLFAGQESTCEYRIVTRKGEVRWLRDSCRPVWDETQGRTTQMHGATQDITERKVAEESLRQAETRYRLLVERLPAITYVISAGPNPKTLYVSPQIEQVFGYTPEEWMADETNWERHIHPDDRARVLAEYKASRAEGRPFVCEYRFVTRDGRVIWLHDEAYHFLESGMAPFSQGIEFDITERKQREREVEAIAAVSNALRSAITRDEILPVILDQLILSFEADGTALALREPMSGDNLFELGRGAFSSLTGLRLPAGEGLAGRAMTSAQAQLIPRIQDDPGALSPDLAGQVRAVACVPLVAEGESIGALLAGRSSEIMQQELRLLSSIGDIAANAIHRAVLHEQTEQRLKRLAALHAIDMAIGSSLDLQFTLSVLLDQTTSQLAVDAADILLLDPHSNMLEFRAGRGFRTPAINQSKFRLGEGQPGWAALERKMVSIPDLASEERNFVRAELLRAEGFNAYYGIPLIAKGQVKGVLEIFHRQVLNPDSDWLDFLRTLAGQAALAIDDAALFNNLQQSNIELTMAYDATIEGWSRALDLRDKETEGHTRRVTEMTVRLARAMGVEDAELIHVRRGALLHDIGKMGVPDAILLKEGELTSGEWEIMRKHPTYAYEMLAPISYLRPALDIPYCHHEKWDGTGYPRGLKELQIPVAARIFAVVDVWDALRSDRPYRKAWSEKKVLAHIQSLKDTHFDSGAMEMFMQSKVYLAPS